MTPELIDRANGQADIVEIAERCGRYRVKLRRVGAVDRGVCPLSGCGEKSGKAPFVVLPGGRRWVCLSCDGRGGDAVDLEHRMFSTVDETMADAARRILGEVRRDEPQDDPHNDSRRARRARDRTQADAAAETIAAWKARLARHLWRGGIGAAGTLAQVYFEEARGIRGPVLGRALAVLRFNPRAYYSGPAEWTVFPPRRGVFLPAVVGLVMTELGPTGGVLCVYLRPDGRAKTDRGPAKKMWGPQGHVLICRADGRCGPPAPGDRGDQALLKLPGGVWLSRPDGPGPLVVAEGYENALSRAMMLSGGLSLPVRAVAAGSLDRLQGRELVDDDGAVDVRAITGDPLRPPFTWPEDPAAPWGVVDIACDADMSSVQVRGRTGEDRRGRRRVARFQRDGAERVRVCRRLAVQGWTRRLASGSATVVRASQPPAGMDFNDIIRAAEAAGGCVA